VSSPIGAETRRTAASTRACACRAPRAALDEVIARTTTLGALAASGRLEIDGNAAKLRKLLELLDPPDPSFAIVTP
jgi:alkyl sulfatase BDS1-like metallo-beta-lactamase superfamily hydrolase